MKKRLISVLLVIALLATVGVIAAQAAGNQESVTFFNSLHTEAEKLSFTTDGQKATCPFCGTEQSWTALTADAAAGSDAALASGHYFVPVGGLTLDNYYYLNSTAKMGTVSVGGADQTTAYCIHLNGQKISASNTVIKTSTGSNCNANIMGTGTIQMTADKSALIYQGGWLRLFGGTYVPMEGATKAVVADSGAASVYGTKRVLVCEGADIQGTLHSGKTSVYALGGHIKKAVWETATEANGTVSVKTQNGYIGNMYTQALGTPEIGGTVKIDELDLTGIGRTVSVDCLSTGASIKVTDDGIFTDALAVETAADAETIKGYFTAVDSDYQINVVENDSKFYLSCDVRADITKCAACGEPTDIISVGAAPSVSALPAGHYQLTADLELTAPLTVAEDVCIDLNGHSVTNTTGRVLEVTAGTVNIAGSGDVIGAATEGDAATVLVSGGELNLKGGTFKHDIASTLPTVYVAGTVTMEDGAKITADKGADDTVTTDDVIGYNVSVDGGTFTMNGGEISNATTTHTTTTAEGGNVSLINKGTFTLNGGTIKDGTANNGGNIAKANGTYLYIKGGTVSGGHANMGGNIFVRAGVFTMEGGTVENGVAKSNGGNIYLNNMTTDNTFKNCVVQNGSAESGGNLAISSTGSTISTKAAKIGAGAKFNGGEATDNGGNILVRGGTLVISDTAAVSGGKAKTGGTIAIIKGELATGAKAPIVNLLGGTVTGGEVQAHGALLFCDVASANVYVNAGTYNEGKANLGGESGSRACNGLYMRAGTMTLSGGIFNCSGAYNAIYLGGSGSNIPALVLGKHSYTSWATAEKVVVNDTENTNKAIGMNALATLNVTEDFDDTLYLGFVSSPAYGAPVPNAESAGDAADFTGKLYMGSRTGNPPILPATYTVTSVNEETQEETTTTVNGLVVAGAQYVKADGEAVWTKDMAAAAAATDAAYVKAYKDETITIPAGTTKVVDLNGNTVTVEGEGAFQGFDSANADYETHGYAKLAAGIENKDTALVITGADGEKYIVLSDENGVSYHRFEARIKSIALKPETVGLYYRVVWQADDTLKAASADMGIALSTSKALSDFANITTATILDKTQKDFRFAQYLPTTIVNNEEQASVLVDGIMKAGLADNSARGQVTIQAVPYLVVGDQVLMGDGRSVSLQGFMLMADQDANYEKNATALEAFYEKWAEYMPAAEGWTFNNIGVKKEA